MKGDNRLNFFDKDLLVNCFDFKFGNGIEAKKEGRRLPLIVFSSLQTGVFLLFSSSFRSSGISLMGFQFGRSGVQASVERVNFYKTAQKGLTSIDKYGKG